MALSTRNRRGLGLIAFFAFALLMIFLEQRVLVPFAMARPSANEVDYWERHVERNEKTAASRLRLGIAYAEVGELAAAEISFANALALESDYDAAAIGRYGVVVRIGEAERALIELDRYAQAHPACAVCWQNLAAEYLRLRNLRAAEAAVHALLASDLSADAKMYSVDNLEVEATVLAGRVYAARGDRARAIDYFRDAVAQDPSDVRAYLLQAKNLLAERKPTAAIAVLEDAKVRAVTTDRSANEIERLIRRAHQVQP